LKRISVAFTGPSNSGKTTLIVRLSTILKEKGYKVSIIKHDPKDKAIFDKEGKDSYKFSNTGADVAVISKNRTTIFKKSFSTIDETIEMLGDFDYLFVEGLKTLDFPRIAIFRDIINYDYLEVSDAIATDYTIKNQDIPINRLHLDLNNINMIINWIDKYGKKV
jgi:molybdopterin-guanine dinucleotide biosynthesis protein B